MKARRRLLSIFGLLVVIMLCPWAYTSSVLANARRTGVYPSAEAGMLALMDQYYPADHEVKIFYAGPDAHDGSKPYVWYVIAEVRASARADGSAMGRNGCDNPGTFFLQTKDGSWVHVREGLFTLFFTSWMKVFDMAGEGQSTPTTDILQHQPQRFCT